MIEVSPIRFRDSDAGEYIGRSKSFMRAQRLRDKELIDMGADPTGPRWYVEGRSVVYYRVDLDAWAAKQKKGGTAYGRQSSPWS